MRDVELLDAPHSSDGNWQRTLEAVKADVEDGGAAKQVDLGWDAAREVVVEEDDLVERPRHAADRGGDASAEEIISQNEDRDRGGA